MGNMHSRAMRADEPKAPAVTPMKTGHHRLRSVDGFLFVYCTVALTFPGGHWSILSSLQALHPSILGRAPSVADDTRLLTLRATRPSCSCSVQCGKPNRPH